jgi:hypothetical protein
MEHLHMVLLRAHQPRLTVLNHLNHLTVSNPVNTVSSHNHKALRMVNPHTEVKALPRVSTVNNNHKARAATANRLLYPDDPDKGNNLHHTKLNLVRTANNNMVRKARTNQGNHMVSRQGNMARLRGNTGNNNKDNMVNSSTDSRPARPMEERLRLSKAQVEVVWMPDTCPHC